MKPILTLIIFFTILPLKAQENDCKVQLNHFLIFVDSTTYWEIMQSEVFNSNFAFSFYKHVSWEGLYFIGEENYIEIFHPNSIHDEYYPPGSSWVCHASLKANCIENYAFPENEQFIYSTNEHYDDISLETSDSSNLFTTWEMNEIQYITWVKKEYSDTMSFLPTDYASAEDADSSKNYLFNNILGLEILANRKDSVNISQYFQMIGYKMVTDENEYLMYMDENEFIELSYTDDLQFPTITTVYFEINEMKKKEEIIIGDSKITLNGKRGSWEFNLSMRR